MRTVKDFEETKRAFELRVIRVRAQNDLEPDSDLHIELPERYFKTRIKGLGRMRTVKDLLVGHVSIYQANKSLGMGKSINKLSEWAANGAIVDDNGQPYIKSGKPIKGWRL